MAVSFGEQIHALTGFDGDSASASEIGENYDDVTAEWMNVAVREVMNILPPQMLERCAKLGAAFDPDAGQTHEDKVISVIRTRDAAASFTTNNNVFVCRQIPHTLSFKASDPDSLEYATETDPVFYYEPQADNTAVLVKVLPSSSANVAKVNSVDYPVFDADGSGSNTNIKTSTSIANFPDEAEYLVVLRAAITAAEYQLAIEEDTDIYANYFKFKTRIPTRYFGITNRKYYSSSTKKG